MHCLQINKKDNTIISNPTLENCLFGAVTLTKHVNIDKYGYSVYGIGFDRGLNFSFAGGGFGRIVLIFGVDMSSSSHIDNKKKDILVLGKGPAQGLEHAELGLEHVNCRKKCIQLTLLF